MGHSHYCGGKSILFFLTCKIFETKMHQYFKNIFFQLLMYKREDPLFAENQIVTSFSLGLVEK
jgi:hypothetical protein